MSIRSLIALENSDNTIESIYCHWGGAPENNGKMLYEHFSDRDKLKELISLGSISALYPRLHPVGKHSCDKPEKDTTVAHRRDGGDSQEYALPAQFGTLRKFLKNLGFFDIEYVYVFTKRGKWSVYHVESDEPIPKRQDLVTLLKEKTP